MTFTVHFSNRVEALQAQLMQSMAAPLSNPLAAEYVLVDNRVLGEWVNMQLAQEQGIAANIRYTQPHELFWLLARALVSQEIPKQTPLSKIEMTWRLYSLLNDELLLATQAMKPVAHYLSGDDSKALKRYQLAASIADLFDQYLVYRPDWILQWDNQAERASKLGEQEWQKTLWLLLTKAARQDIPTGMHHRAIIEQQLLEKLQSMDGDSVRKALPMQRLLVFGISSMPEKLVQLLAGLGQHIDVNACIINPCREYWSQIQSARTLAKKESADQYIDDLYIDDQYYEIGNPLLASQGVQVRDFIALLQNYDVIENDHYDDSVNPETLLQSIQHEIRDLTYKGEVASQEYVTAGKKCALPTGDGNTAQCIPSVHIHSCHSAMREIEVLHDQVRDIMQKNKDILPRDIVVMMPKVASYAPYIHAVFNGVNESHNQNYSHSEQTRIRYHITDRSVAEESPLFACFETLLQLPVSRLPLSDVLSLLEVPAVQRRFKIDQQAYETIKRWLTESGVRWGLNAAHRESLGLPAYSDFSWEFGLDRMMSGYAMHTNSDELSASIFTASNTLPVLPYDDIEGGLSTYLDAFLHFWHTLLKWRDTLNQEVTATVWAENIRSLLDDFFQAETEDEQLAIKTVLAALSVLDDKKCADWYAGLLPLSVVQAIIKPVMQQTSVGQHHWREGVKFCSLMPMRGVPFKVVYVLGMNLDDYPRRVERKSFDLMRNNHRAGDRASRIDDRWLFLEALLSARRYFHISYIGHDMHRNEQCEPSVVLSELMDYCRHGYDLPANYLVTHHPLQPFGKDYFLKDKKKLSSDSVSARLVSFNRLAWEIASAKNSTMQTAVMGDERWTIAKNIAVDSTVYVTLDEFVKFFIKPWDWFFSKKHKVWLDIEDASVDDNETLDTLDNLQQWGLRNTLIQQINAQLPLLEASEESRDELIEQLTLQQQAAAAWPLGQSAEKMTETLKTLNLEYLWASQGSKPLHVSIPIAYGSHTLLIECQFSVMDDGCFIVHSASKTGEHHQLDFYIRLALLAAAVIPGFTLQKGMACFYDDKKGRVLQEILKADIDDATNARFLSMLAELYITYQQTGLPFEPKLSKQLADLREPEDSDAETMDDNTVRQNAEDRLAAVDEAWNTRSEWVTGMAFDAKKSSYFAHVEAVKSASFQAVSERVWEGVSAWYQNTACRVEQDAADKKAAKAAKGKKS